MKVPVEISARHVHLAREDFEILFGKGAELTFRKALSQPGEFLANERVDLVGLKRNIENVAVLGPFRARSQVELSLTDCRGIGLNAPVRESGELDGSAGVTLVGSAGKVELQQGLIIAKRHIHMTEEEARKAGLVNKQEVSVVVSGSRPLEFGEVVVRVNDAYKLAFHIDTDEANAAGVDGVMFGEISR